MRLWIANGGHLHERINRFLANINVDINTKYVYKRQHSNPSVVSHNQTYSVLFSAGCGRKWKVPLRHAASEIIMRIKSSTHICVLNTIMGKNHDARIFWSNFVKCDGDLISNVEHFSHVALSTSSFSSFTLTLSLYLSLSNMSRCLWQLALIFPSEHQFSPFSVVFD